MKQQFLEDLSRLVKTLEIKADHLSKSKEIVDLGNAGGIYISLQEIHKFISNQIKKS